MTEGNKRNRNPSHWKAHPAQRQSRYSAHLFVEKRIMHMSQNKKNPTSEQRTF